MKVCVLGATGAIGVPITRFFENKGSVLKLHSKNCDLNNVQGIADFLFEDCGIFVNASGTFGGLKSYESGGLDVASTYYRNLSGLIDQLKPRIIINISSASVSNKENHDSDSPYYEYVKIKQKIETLVSNKSVDTVLHLRCTNIVSKYENFRRSGHSISSIYKKYLEANDQIEIWSNEQDWREYIDTDDLVSLMPAILDLRGHHTLTIGSGQKTYMRDVIKYFNKYMNYQGKIVFTQPHKSGPQTDVISLPSILLENNNISITPMEHSIRKTVHAWNSINDKDDRFAS